MKNNWFYILNILSFLIIPVIIPSLGIYFVQKNKNIYKLTGKKFLIMSFLILLIWAYFELNNSNSPYFIETNLEAYFQESMLLLGPLVFFYIGIYAFLENKLWLKVAGVLVALFSLLVFLAFTLMGTP